jgi:CRISPR-associated protein Cas2
MNYRYMRVLVFFDLPTLTGSERREYTRFRKYLIKSGFLMEQESVYSKLVVNSAAADALANNVRRNAPSEGLVQLMRVTENQYARMEYIVGDRKNEVIDSGERLVIL